MRRIGTAGRLWWRYVRETKAVSALEYAILVGVVAVALVAVMSTFNTRMEQSVSKIGDNVKATVAGVGN